MAVVDRYIDANLADGQKQEADIAGGAKALILFPSFSVAAGDDNGSVYRIMRIESNARMFDIEIACTAITDGTDYDLGLYNVDLGPVVDADLFMIAADFSSASRSIDGMSAVAVADLNKPIWQLLGLSKDPMTQYDLAITANVVGTVAGDIAVKILTAQN